MISSVAVTSSSLCCDGDDLYGAPIPAMLASEFGGRVGRRARYL